MRLAAALVLVCTLTLSADERPRIPTLTAYGDDGNVALELTALTVRVTVRGHLARTELEMTYRNSLDRTTGGEFTFPLPPDAEVSDVGLWFGEHLRRGVAVERVLARQAYEETIHRAVDPALVEWRAGRTFSYEIYPIPAKGEKKVYLAYDQELTSNDYILDLRWARGLRELDLHVDAEGRERRVDGVVRVPRERSESAFVARGDDGHWYASAAIDVEPREQHAQPASHVLVLVDTSASSLHQNAAHVRRFLTSFLARQNAWATADVVPFHMNVDTPRRIEKAGNAAGAIELERILRELQPLGPTNLLAVTEELPKLAASLPPAARIVLVTDGLSSLGDSREVTAAVRALTALRRPVLVVNASQNTDDLLLRNAAMATGGWHIDLTSVGIDDAVRTAMRVPEPIRFAEEIVPRAILAPEPARVVIAARSNEPITRMPAQLPPRELHSPIERSMVRRAYARVQLRELLARGATDDEILAHGRAFTQVTPRTSLLVLETWRDYERYEIEMPPDVLEEKCRHEERQRYVMPPPSVPVIEHGPWSVHGKIIATDLGVLPGVTVWLVDGTKAVSMTVSDAEGHYTLFAPVAPAQPRVHASLAGFDHASAPLPADAPGGASVDLTLELLTVAETITVTAEGPAIEVMSVASSATSLRGAPAVKDRLLLAIENDTVTGSDDPEVIAAVAKQRRELTRDVLDKLRGIRSHAERLRYYISARALLGGDRSFHVFAAEIFRERSPEVAVRVLLDLAEARPDDAPLLRLLARVVDGWGEPRLARLLLLRAIEIAPTEAQSLRELLLLDAREGRANAVAAHAKRLRADTDHQWTVREVYEIAGEAIARWDRAGASDQQRGLELRADPDDDITIDLIYDTGWLWMDLHVIEPSGARVAWDQKQSPSGGRLRGGHIFGYGPQIYSIRNAQRGTYRLDVDYYSTDDTNVTQETLAHIIVIHNGKRRDHFLVLGREKERQTLAEVKVP